MGGLMRDIGKRRELLKQTDESLLPGRKESSKKKEKGRYANTATYKK